MTYLYQINYYRSSSNDYQYWMYLKAFVLLLLLNTIAGIFYYYLTILIVVNIFLGLVFLGITKILLKRVKMPFIEIQDGILHYFNTENQEIVKVSAKDITHISTRLCELRIHTNEEVHVINLKVIRNEQTRWEIKEKIRTLVSA